MRSGCSCSFLFALLPAFVWRIEGTVDWKFQTLFDGPFTFDIQVGTPPVSTQVLGLVDSWDAVDEDLSLADSTVGGAYDHTQSSTWVQTAVHYDVDGNPDGLIGTETFIIGGQAKTSLPFSVQNNSHAALNPQWGSVAFGRTKLEVASFVAGLLSNESDKVVSFTYDTNPNPFTGHWHHIYGTAQIGGRQPSKCSSDWLEIDEFPDGDFDWRVPLDEFTVGPFTYATGGAVNFQTSSMLLFLPTEIFTSVVQLMGGQTTEEGSSVQCDFSNDFVFTISGTDFNVGMADVIDQSTATEAGQCEFLGFPIDCESNDCYSLPLAALRNHCLLYRYDPPGVGIAPMIN